MSYFLGFFGRFECEINARRLSYHVISSDLNPCPNAQPETGGVLFFVQHILRQPTIEPLLLRLHKGASVTEHPNPETARRVPHT